MAVGPGKQLACQGSRCQGQSLSAQWERGARFISSCSCPGVAGPWASWASTLGSLSASRVPLSVSSAASTARGLVPQPVAYFVKLISSTKTILRAVSWQLVVVAAGRRGGGPSKVFCLSRAGRRETQAQLLLSAWLPRQGDLRQAAPGPRVAN